MKCYLSHSQALPELKFFPYFQLNRSSNEFLNFLMKILRLHGFHLGLSHSLNTLWNAWIDIQMINHR